MDTPPWVFYRRLGGPAFGDDLRAGDRTRGGSMTSVIKRLFVALLGVMLAAVAGCATKQAAYSGFLQNYPVFKPGPDGGADFVYIKKGVDFGVYDKIMMDHVVLFFKDDSEYKGIHPEELQEISDAFHKAFVEALGNDYPIVKSPGPDVLRIRTAIIDVETSNPGVSAVTTVVPIGLAVSLVKKGTTGEHTGVGSASMEAELLDSLTNERIGAAIDTESGGKFDGLSKLGGAKAAFAFWAQRLKIFLDEAHGR